MYLGLASSFRILHVKNFRFFLQTCFFSSLIMLFLSFIEHIFSCFFYVFTFLSRIFLKKKKREFYLPNFYAKFEVLQETQERSNQKLWFIFRFVKRFSFPLFGNNNAKRESFVNGCPWAT